MVEESRKRSKNLSPEERCVAHVEQAIAALGKVPISAPRIAHWSEGLRMLEEALAFLAREDAEEIPPAIYKVPTADGTVLEEVSAETEQRPGEPF